MAAIVALVVITGMVASGGRAAATDRRHPARRSRPHKVTPDEAARLRHPIVRRRLNPRRPAQRRRPNARRVDRRHPDARPPRRRQRQSLAALPRIRTPSTWRRRSSRSISRSCARRRTNIGTTSLTHATDRPTPTTTLGCGPMGRLIRLHDGIDIYADEGEPLAAVFAGTVIDPDTLWQPWEPDRYGKVIVIRSDEPADRGLRRALRPRIADMGGARRPRDAWPSAGRARTDRQCRAAEHPPAPALRAAGAVPRSTGRHRARIARSTPSTLTRR